MNNLFEDFTISILRLNKLVQRIKIYEVKKFDLQPIHVMCCYYLIKNPKGLTAKEIGELSLEDKGAVSRALKSMHEKGYVNYETGRNSIVTLTDEGKKVAEYICGRAEIAAKEGSVDFTDEERLFFYKSLDTIVENLKKYYSQLIGKEK